MRDSLKRGFSFGLTSGVITTLGMIVGLSASTHSFLAVIGGIVVIALADSLSDAFGMHMSEEFSDSKNQKHIWESTWATFLFKFIFALTFIIPFLVLKLETAILVSIVYGLFLIGAFSYYIGNYNRVSKRKIILEHLGIAVFVIIVTHLVGSLVRAIFV